MPSDPLDRAHILAAAIDLLDTDGLEGLSMRKLGARLGAGATSLYWYVKNKDELFALAADEVFGELELPDPAAVGWSAAAAEMARGLRATILRHAWLASIFGSHPVYGPKIARWVDHSLAVFSAAGFTGSDLDDAGDAILAFVLGSTLSEAAMRAKLRREGAKAEAYAADLMTRAREIAADFPRLRERFDAPQEGDGDRGFEFGLQTFLAGLAARAHP